MSWGVGFCESPHMGFTSTAVHCCRSLFASLSSPTILPERLARCLDSWAEPQQVYRLQFRGLAATRAGDGRVMRPCTTQRGARHKSRHTQGLRAHQRSWFRTPEPLISNREHGNSHNKSLNSRLPWFKGKGGLSCNKAPHQIASIRTHQRS